MATAAYHHLMCVGPPPNREHPLVELQLQCMYVSSLLFYFFFYFILIFIHVFLLLFIILLLVPFLQFYRQFDINYPILGIESTPSFPLYHSHMFFPPLFALPSFSFFFFLSFLVARMLAMAATLFSRLHSTDEDAMWEISPFSKFATSSQPLPSFDDKADLKEFVYEDAYDLICDAMETQARKYPKRMPIPPLPSPLPSPLSPLPSPLSPLPSPLSPDYILYFILYIIYSIFYILYYIFSPYILTILLYFIFYILYFIFYILYFIFYILYFIFYILYFIFYILYFIFYILYFIFYILGTGKETSTTRSKSLNENEHVIRVQSRTQAKFGLENFFTRNNSCHMFLLV